MTSRTVTPSTAMTRTFDDPVVTGFNTSIVRAANAGICVLLLVYTLLAGQLVEHPWMWGPFIAGIVASVVLTRPGGRLSEFDSVVLICSSVVASLALLAYNDPADNIWMYIFASYLVTAQAGRGNLIGALTGAFLVCVVGAAWAGFHAADPSGYVAVLAIPVLNPLVFAWLHVVMKRYVVRARQHRSEAARSAEAKAAAAAALELGRRELAEVRREAEPLLRRLSGGETLGEGFRAELVTIEATIRDRIRSPRLQHPVLNVAIRNLRQQGATVLLLGEADEGGFSPMGDALAEAVSERIGDLGAGSRVTIRSLSAQSDAALTLLVSQPHDTYRISFADDGTVIARS